MINVGELRCLSIYLYGFCENSVAVNLMYHYVPSQIAVLFPHAHPMIHWINLGFFVVKSMCLMVMFDGYPLVNVYITMENHHV